MVTTTTWTAARTDRGLTRAHGGARLAIRPGTCAPATKQSNGLPSMFGVVRVPAYTVADQESHPPREPVG